MHENNLPDADEMTEFNSTADAYLEKCMLPMLDSALE